MKSVYLPSADTAPPIILQADRVRRRIAASDAVAALVASLAFGERRRSDSMVLASLTVSRVADTMEARS